MSAHGGAVHDIILKPIFSVPELEGPASQHRNAFFIPAFTMFLAAGFYFLLENYSQYSLSMQLLGLVMGFGDDGPRPDMFLPPYEKTMLQGFCMVCH